MALEQPQNSDAAPAEGNKLRAAEDDVLRRFYPADSGLA
jgi:hypothetical protein